MMRFAAPLVLLGILAAGGCAGASRPVPVEERGVEPATGSPEAAAAAPAPAGRDQDAVVVALMSESDERLRAGNAESAAQSLERALHLRPKDGWVWHRLARVRLEQRRLHQAVGLAEKSNSLAGGDRGLRAANWEIIASARAALGDEAGARAARLRAREYAAPE